MYKKTEVCYLHSTRQAANKCDFCKETFCNACMRGILCRNCDEINNYIYSLTVQGQIKQCTTTDEETVILGKRKILTQKYILEIADESDPANTNIITLPSSYFFGLPCVGDMVQISYLDSEVNKIGAIWLLPKSNDEVPSLLYTSQEVRKVSGIFSRFLVGLLGFFLPSIGICYYSGDIAQGLLTNLSYSFGLQIIISILGVLIGILITKYLYRNFIYPNRWKSEFTKFEGTVVAPVDVSDVVRWEIRFANNNKISNGWKLFLKVKRNDNNKIIRVLIEGTQDEEIIIPEVNNIDYYFKGRLLLGVLICSNELKNDKNKPFSRRDSYFVEKKQSGVL